MFACLASVKHIMCVCVCEGGGLKLMYKRHSTYNFSLEIAPSANIT